MGIEENKEVVRKFTERTLKGDASIVEEFLTSDFVLHSLGMINPVDRNREVVKQSLGSSTYSYKSIITEDIVAEGDKVVVRDTVSIHHSGRKTFFNTELEEGGKTVTFPRCSIFRIEEGKIAELWLLENNFSQFQQLGILPPTEEIGK